jgi:NADH-quinone oxidoreductase subunit K
MLIIFFILFIIGLSGIVVNRKNIILLLMSIELMLLAINLFFIYYSMVFDDMAGQLFSFFILLVAGAESAIGLSILIAFFRVKGNIYLQFIHLLKG